MSLAGPRRDWEADREVRVYTCRACGSSARDYWPPFGWLQVRTRDPQASTRDHSYLIAGLFCTARCLTDEAAGWATTTAAAAQEGQEEGQR